MKVTETLDLILATIGTGCSEMLADWLLLNLPGPVPPVLHRFPTVRTFDIVAHSSEYRPRVKIGTSRVSEYHWRKDCFCRIILGNLILSLYLVFLVFSFVV